jgi:predicted nucleotidyltransferase
MNVALLRDRVSGIFERQGAVRVAYLFGSQATGDTGPMSDYDFAVLIQSPAEWLPLQAALAHALTVALGTARVDLVLLNRAPIELAYAVIARGAVLFERDLATRVEYEADVMSRYGDYLPVLRAQREDILQGGNHARRVQWYRAALERTERTLGEIKASGGQGTQRL